MTLDELEEQTNMLRATVEWQAVEIQALEWQIIVLMVAVVLLGLAVGVLFFVGWGC